MANYEWIFPIRCSLFACHETERSRNAGGGACLIQIRKEKNRKQNADRRNWYSAGPYGPGRASQRRGAHLSAFHRGSRPKESFIARDSASGQASWDVAGTRFAHPVERAPRPVPVQRKHLAP